MQYVRVNSIQDPLFRQIHDLLGRVFPKEEVLAFELWEEPLQDPGIRVFAAVDEGVVVGVTEYRYYPDMEVAMTDFTIIGRDGMGIGPYLVRERERDLRAVAAESGGQLLGMFAEIYNPALIEDWSFGGVKAMHPVVRREVLSHLGYRKLAIDYVHPSWENDGSAVGNLDLGYMTIDSEASSLPASRVHAFLSRYYAILEPKPAEWLAMMTRLEAQGDAEIALLPL